MVAQCRRRGRDLADAAVEQQNKKHRASELAARLLPGRIFAMWSDDPPEENFMNSLRAVFPEREANVVSFYNPLQVRDLASTVDVAGS